VTPPAPGVRWVACGLWLALLLAGRPATAQSADDDLLAIDLAATEQTLWLLQAGPRQSLFYRRGVNEPFQAGEPLNTRLTAVVGTPDGVYGFSATHELWSSSGSGWTRELDLPDGLSPLDLVGDETGLYALTRSPPVGELPRLASGVRPPTSQPFDPGPAALSVLRYDSQGWAAVAACPPALRPEGTIAPRIALLRDELYIFWHPPDGERVSGIRFDPRDGRWQPAGLAPQVTGLRQFWITSVNRVPTLVVASQVTPERDELHAFRALGSSDALLQWRPAQLQLSTLPADVSDGVYHAACGFNQHIALLMQTKPGVVCVRFGRLDAPPAETTRTLAEILAARVRPLAQRGWVQAATLVVLGVLLVMLFIFRRGALAAPALLPRGCAPALTVQRLLAWLIDLAPFALVIATVTGVDWRGALHELSSWASGGEPSTPALPSGATLLWWGASCACQTVYALVMEGLMQRTVGKLLLGTCVLAENGQRPRFGQVVVRNLLRFVELLPPCWLLGFLVVLSRKRQRLGDLLARTIVVRGYRPKPPSEGPGDERRG
jgi:uncharacterized RDD family membrane protein YckC